MAIYLIHNGPFPTTAAPAVAATGTAIETLLQVKGVTGVQFKVIEYGVSFDGSAAATPITVELIETGTVFATVTASVAADIVKWGDPNAPTSTVYFSVGTTATGYNASAEGTITASRLFDFQLVSPTNQYVKQFPLGREPKVNADSALRIRTTSGASVGAYAYIIAEV